MPGRRKGSGRRAAEALRVVRDEPGIRIPEIAARMGINSNYLYRVLPALEDEGKVIKQGGGWFERSAWEKVPPARQVAATGPVGLEMICPPVDPQASSRSTRRSSTSIRFRSGSNTSKSVGIEMAKRPSSRISRSPSTRWSLELLPKRRWLAGWRVLARASGRPDADTRPDCRRVAYVAELTSQLEAGEPMAAPNARPTTQHERKPYYVRFWPMFLAVSMSWGWIGRRPVRTPPARRAQLRGR